MNIITEMIIRKTGRNIQEYCKNRLQTTYTTYTRRLRYGTEPRKWVIKILEDTGQTYDIFIKYHNSNKYTQKKYGNAEKFKQLNNKPASNKDEEIFIDTF